MTKPIPFDRYAPYLSAKFTPNGRSIDKGFDCYGFVWSLMRDVYGIDIGDQWQNADISNATQYFDAAHRAIEAGRTNWEKVQNPELAHVVLLRRRGIISHIGFILDKNRFIHITEQGHVRIDRFDSPLWKSQIEGFYRWSK